MTTQIGAMPISTAVATTFGLEPKAPSPTSAIAGRSMPAAATPSTADGPKPIVEKPPGRQERVGRVDRVLLRDAVLVPADVRDQDGVGHRAPDDRPGSAPGAAGSSAEVALARLGARKASRSSRRRPQSYPRSGVASP